MTRKWICPFMPLLPPSDTRSNAYSVKQNRQGLFLPCLKEREFAV
jgi:hypothetical protein